MTERLAKSLRMAARSMHRHGLSHAYGHVSGRIDEGRFLVTPPLPLGLVTPHEPGLVVSSVGELPAGALPEVCLHQAIYTKRPEIGAICRVQPPSVIALSVLGRTPRALHGLGTYFAPQCPIWQGVSLVRDNGQANLVADMMGKHAAIVLSGNGCVVAAATVEEAAVLAYFLEDAARIELAVLPAEAAGQRVREYLPDEVSARAIRTGGLFERMWQYLTFNDEEAELDSGSVDALSGM